MSTDLVERNGRAATAAPEDARMLRPLMEKKEADQVWELAGALYQSGMFKGLQDAKQGYAKILIGRDLGLSPTQSLMTLDLVEGAVFMRGVLLAGFVRQSKDYNYKVISRTNDGCKLLFLGYPQLEKPEAEEGPYAPQYVKMGGRWWEVLGDEEFTIQDAKRAGLVKADKLKSAWMAHPKNMCFWRCISNAVKFNAPDLLGGMPVYVHEVDVIESTAEVMTDGGLPAGQAPIHPDVIWARLGETAEPETIQRLRTLTMDWPPARIEMTLAGRSAEGLAELADQMEAQAATAVAEAAEAAAETVQEPPETSGDEEPVDADVIEENADVETPGPVREKLDERLPDAEEPSAEVLAELEKLRIREDDLTQALDSMDLMDGSHGEVVQELEQVQSRIKELGGSTGNNIAF